MASQLLSSRAAVVIPARAIALILTTVAFAHTAHAAVIDADPSNYQNLAASLAAGDTLRLAPGTYPRGLLLGDKAGTAAQPIIVTGPDDRSAVFTAPDCCNTVQLEGTSYLKLANLTLDGGAHATHSGLDSRGASHHITVENLKIVGYSGNSQTAGIETEGPAWNWVIRRDTIVGAGTGLRLGAADGTQPFVAGVVEYNVVLDSLGSNLEVARQLVRPAGMGLPTASTLTIIRHNVFSKQTATTAAAIALPNVMLGHFPLSGAGANDRYEIYGNFFYENPTAALLQAEGNLAVHDNLFVSSTGDAVNIQPRDDKPRNVTVYDNTVVARGSGLRISGADPAFAQRLVANASFAEVPISGPNQMSNVTGTYAAAAESLNAPFAAIGSLDLFPKSGRLAGSAMDPAMPDAFTDGAKDFNGTARSGLHRGAYEGDGVNSGWRLALSEKPAAGANALSITLSADPAQVSAQGSTTLQWSVTGASSCTASEGWTGSKAPSGSETVGPIAKDKTYAVTCSGANGSASKSVHVLAVNAAATPSVTMTASPGNVSAGGTSIISWTSTAVDACSASGGWSGTKGANGSETVGPLQSTTSFQLTCLGAAGNANGIVQITVGGTSTPPTTPPSTPPPSDPPPTSPTPTTPTTPPTTPTTPSMGSSGGGGGSLDFLLIGFLAILAGVSASSALRNPALRRSRKAPRPRSQFKSG